MTCWFGYWAVPTKSRERSDGGNQGVIVHARLPTNNSAALKRADDFDGVSRRQSNAWPIGAPDHTAVERDRQKAGFRIDAAPDKQLGDRRHRDRLFDTV